jgi:hypothetical protein
MDLLKMSHASKLVLKRAILTHACLDFYARNAKHQSSGVAPEVVAKRCFAGS